MNTSAGCRDRPSSNSVTIDRVAFQRRPGEDRCVALAVEHDIAQGDAVGRDETAGAAGDLHGERLGVTGAEGVDDAAGLERLDDQLAGGVDGIGVGALENPLEAAEDLAAVRRRQVAHERFRLEGSPLTVRPALVNNVVRLPCICPTLIAKPATVCEIHAIFAQNVASVKVPSGRRLLSFFAVVSSPPLSELVHGDGTNTDVRRTRRRHEQRTGAGE